MAETQTTTVEAKVVFAIPRMKAAFGMQASGCVFTLLAAIGCFSASTWGAVVIMASMSGLAQYCPGNV